MTITTIVKVSTQGVSRPYVCLGDDGQVYWCKGNHTGLRALMLEWISAKIAHVVGLPVPECHIARLSPKLFRAWQDGNGAACPEIVVDSNPYVFAPFLEAVWSEMPTEWTDPGEAILSLDDVKTVLLGGVQ